MENKSTYRTVSVMFVDIVGYTSKTASMKRDEFNQLHNVFDGMVIPVTKNFSSQVIKKVGDAYLITFDTATDALLCGIKLQQKFKEYNKGRKDKLEIRVAVDHGEVLIKENDAYGDPVNTTSRIEQITPPGQVYFSESVAQFMNKNEISYTEIGPVQLKGLPEPIMVFRVFWDSDKRKQFGIRIAEVAVLAFIIVLIIYLVQVLNARTDFISSAAVFFENLF